MRRDIAILLAVLALLGVHSPRAAEKVRLPVQVDPATGRLTIHTTDPRIRPGLTGQLLLDIEGIHGFRAAKVRVRETRRASGTAILEVVRFGAGITLEQVRSGNPEVEFSLPPLRIAPPAPPRPAAPAGQPPPSRAKKAPAGRPSAPPAAPKPPPSISELVARGRYEEALDRIAIDRGRGRIEPAVAIAMERSIEALRAAANNLPQARHLLAAVLASGGSVPEKARPFVVLAVREVLDLPPPHFEIVLPWMADYPSLTRDQVKAYESGVPAVLRHRDTGLVFHWIPADETVVIGCDEPSLACDADARPTRRVRYQHGFWLQATETTVAAWQAQPVPPGAVPLPLPLQPSWSRTPDAPVARVTWSEANEFCRRLGGRLPGEVEWEFAARLRSANGTPPRDGCDGNLLGTTVTDPWADPVPVDRLSARPDGIRGLCGNLMEWVADGWDPSPPTLRPAETPAAQFRSIRGASAATHRTLAVPWRRLFARPDTRWDVLGFRCLVPGNPTPARAVAHRSTRG